MLPDALSGPELCVSTVDAVLQRLPNASIVHLACHGRQHPTSSLSSGFAFQDGPLTILQLMQVTTPKAFFAFLSACESAMGDRSQPDELVHLAAAFLFLGFKSIVGTLW